MTTRRQFISGLSVFVVGSAGCATQTEDLEGTATHAESEEVFANCKQVESSATAHHSDGIPPSGRMPSSRISDGPRQSGS